MKGLALLLPVLVALQVGVQPALAWTWPVDGPVLRPFVLGDDPYAGGQHRGIDIGAPAGTPVRAPAAGAISFAGTVPTGGKTITIRTADGYAVTLQHLGSYSVTRGADVAEGSAIASIGTDQFVYLGVRRADEEDGYVDPLGLLPAPAPAPAPPDPPAADPDPVPAPTDGGGAAKHHDPVRSPQPAVVAKPLPKPERERADHPRARSVRATHGARGGAGAATNRRVRSPQEGRRPLAPPVSASSLSGRAPMSAGAVSFVTSERPLWPFFAGAALLGLGLFGAGRLARRRRELGDARAADGAPAVLLQRAAAAAEDADGLRLGQQNHVVLDRDLERILLAERKTLADLDRNDNPAEVVDVADDPRFRCSPCRARPDGALRRSVRPQFLVAFRSWRISGDTSPRIAISNHHSLLRRRVGSFV